jgi:type IV pilus assembly protein PilE
MNLRTYRYSRGVTLIELMIVVVIASILMAIAVPSYTSYVLRSHRVEAKTALLDLAGREERFFSTSVNGANYSALNTDLGYQNPFPTTVGSGYYTVSLCAMGPNPGEVGACPVTTQTAPGYEIEAVPVVGSTQASDTQCGKFAVDNTGQQWAWTAAGVPNTQYCWNN